MTDTTPTQPTFWRTASGRTFLIIWIGQLVSLLGSSLTTFALGVWIYEQTGSATQFAVNLLAYILPTILAAPVAGLVTDRYDRRLVMIGSDMLAGISTLTVLVLFATNNLAVWHVYVATFLSAAANTFQWPAYGAATTMLVPKDQLGRASGLTQSAEAASELLGPAIAGALYVAMGMRILFLIDVVSFVFAITTMLLVRIPAPEKVVETLKQGQKGGLLHEASYGLRYLRERPALLSILLLFAGANFVSRFSFALLPPMLLDQTSPDVLGYVTAVMGAGTLIGTVLLSIWGGPKRRVYGIAGAGVVIGAGMILIGLTPLLALIALGGLLIQMSGSIGFGSSQALWQSKVAPGVQGRVFAVRRMVAFSIVPIAYLLAGPASDFVFTPALMPGGALANTVIGQILGVGPGRGIGLIFVIAGLLHTILALLFVLIPRVRRIELEMPDAVTEAAEEPVEALPDAAVAVS
jgi:MFS transporter, DHA3 family, macrolide efflux protein